MPQSIDISLIIPTCPDRLRKLKALLKGIAATTNHRKRFEVIVVVDDEDDTPLELAEGLLRGIRFQGLTQPHAGPATARNRAIEHARGDWLLFFDDDALLDPSTIPGHLQRIDGAGDQELAHLGRVDWPEYLVNSPWRRLLANSSMLFFWDKMRDGQLCGFRHFWTSNLSVRTDRVRQVGAFNESFPIALHEDIELGWRLQQQFGLQVCPAMEIHSWHDHAISPRDYFRREHRSGHAAALARQINADFHDAVWAHLDCPHEVVHVMETLFSGPSQQLRETLEQWSMASDRMPGADELQAMYLAHLPLKRWAFCRGYTELPFDEWWGASLIKTNGHAAVITR